MQTPLLAASVLALALIASCRGAHLNNASVQDAEALTSTPARSDLTAQKDAFFSSDQMYYARIDGWRREWMSPASLDAERSVRGATFSLYKADPHSQQHCPDGDASDDQLVYKTTDFTLRTSGNKTKGTPKSSYKIKLEDNSFLGMKALNLKSMWNDASQMREALAWQLFKQAGIVSPGHTYAKLCIGGKYFGLYSVIEQIDGAFLKSHFAKNSKGNLFKQYWFDIGPADLRYRAPQDPSAPGKEYFKKPSMDDRSYQLKSNDKADEAAFQTYDDLAQLIAAINGKRADGTTVDPASPAYKEALDKVFNVKAYLRWAAVNMLLGAWDNYWATPANYYLYNAGHADKPKGFMQEPYFYWLPWDYDNTFGITYWSTRWQYVDIVDWEASTKSYYGGNKTAKLPAIATLLKNTDYMTYYLDFVEWMLDKHFNAGAISPRRAQLWRHVRDAAFLESDTDSGAAHTGRQYTNHQVYQQGDAQEELSNGAGHLEGIDHYVEMRHDSAKQQLNALRSQYPRQARDDEFEAPVPVVE